MKKLKWIVIGLVLLWGGYVMFVQGSQLHIEQYFHPLRKLYPTQQVADLFKKYPTGGVLTHIYFTKEEDVPVCYTYSLTVNSIFKTIEGTEEKEHSVNGHYETISIKPVEYQTGKMVYTQDGGEIPFQFLFERLDYQQIVSYEVVYKQFNGAVPLYTIEYRVPDEKQHLYMGENATDVRVGFYSSLTGVYKVYVEEEYDRISESFHAR